MKTLYLALLLATSAAHALSDSEKETLMTAAVEAHERQDYATALEKWRTLAEAGDAAAQNNLGVLYAEGQGVAQDYAQARAWWEKAAAQGYAAAQYNLGALYENGQGITQDYDKARTWYEKVAAQTDNKEAQQAAQQVLQDLDKTGNNKP